jgi:thymidylate synthase (FAD)
MIGKQATKNKQSSEQGFTAIQAERIQEVIAGHTQQARERYEYLLEMGVARELARLVIPVNQYTRFRASANLRNWLAFLTLRMDSGAQWEIRQYADAVAKEIAGLFPRTYTLFEEGR